MKTELEPVSLQSPMQAILPILKRQVPPHYRVGDTLESVAYREGMLTLIRFIEEKIMHTRQTKETQNGLHTTYEI